MDDSFYLAQHAAARCFPCERNLCWKFLINNSNTINISNKVDNLSLPLCLPQSSSLLLFRGQSEPMMPPHHFLNLWTLWTLPLLFFYELIWVWVISLFPFPCPDLSHMVKMSTKDNKDVLVACKEENCKSPFHFLFELS